MRVDADRAALHGRPRRLTVRARLTLTYTALFTVAGAIMLGGIYLFMRYVPTYAIRSVTVDATTATAATQFSQTQPSDDTSVGLALPTSGSAALVVSDQSDILNTLLIASAVILLVLAALSAWAGWIISGRMLKPLHEISIAAQRAATGAFDHRVALAGPRDEITELSDTFDHMLERLGRSFHAHRRFAANASHELRTPLATTQTMLDVAARDTRLDADMRDLVVRLRETNTRSIQTVEAILDLADLTHEELETTRCDAGEAVEAAVADIRGEATARRIDVQVDTRRAPLDADPRLLAQLLGNLLRNAVRHNVEGGQIVVRAGVTGGPDGGRAVVTITNTGAVVPQHRLTRLVEPFYRDVGRVTSGELGSRGLGLAIVDSIVVAHEGTLDIAANHDGGLRVRVEFPRV
ncbi:HAMP domain-containing histidine kinase [Plantibacter flavus]|uniref:sensor histidine kinase n=1 Tax=Plantibacter flavus TaxID=150123 RepID=UPI003F190D02